MLNTPITFKDSICVAEEFSLLGLGAVLLG